MRRRGAKSKCDYWLSNLGFYRDLRYLMCLAPQYLVRTFCELSVELCIVVMLVVGRVVVLVVVDGFRRMLCRWLVIAFVKSCVLSPKDCAIAAKF